MILKDAAYGGYVLAPLNGFGAQDWENYSWQTAVDNASPVGTSDPITPDNAAGTGASGGGFFDTVSDIWNTASDAATKAKAAADEALRIKAAAEATAKSAGIIGGEAVGGATPLQAPPGGGRVQAVPVKPRPAVPGGGGIAFSDPQYVEMLNRTGGRIGGGTGRMVAGRGTPAMVEATKALIGPRNEVITKTPYGQPSSISLPKIGLGVALGYLLFFR